jgi:hypothetical protein
MRDLQRLEELSSTAALGLWADDVVLALHRATEESGPDEADSQLLDAAATILDATRERAEQPTAIPTRSARSLAATDTALSIVVSLAQTTSHDEQESAERVPAILSSLAALLREAGKGQMIGAKTPEAIAAAADFFGRLGEMQLVESNSVLTSRKNADVWTAMRTTSSFS